MTKLDELLQLEKTLNNETAWQTHIAKTLVKNSPLIQNYEQKLKDEGQKLPFVSFDKNDFIKGVKTEPEKTHTLLNRNPRTGLWGHYKNFTEHQITYCSPNLNHHDQENREAEAFLKNEGVTQEFFKSQTAFTNKYNDPIYSLNWCIAYFELLISNRNTLSAIDERTKQAKSLYQITEQSEKTRIESEIKQLKSELGISQPTDSTISTPVDTTKPTDPVTGAKPSEENKPISTLPISEQKPVVSIPDNSQVGLPANAPEEWRDKLAEHPFLKKRITELEQQLQQQRNDFDRMLKEAEGEVTIQKEEIGNLQMDKSELKAERDDWKRKAEVANEWSTAFPLKTPAMVKSDLASKVTLTASQQEAIDKYPQLKTDLENWTKAFADFANPEKARSAYEQAIKNQVTPDHDKNSEDLREYQTAFPNYPGSDFFGKKPQDIRNLYDNLKKNQTPNDYQSIKDKLESWINIFTNDPDLQGKEPAKVKEYLESLRTNFQQQSINLLSEYRGNIKRRVDSIISRLEKVEKSSLEAKYSGTMYDIYPKLTLDNWAASEKNLRITLAICATEKATAWAKQVEKLPTGAERTTQTKDLGAFVAKVERNWLQTQISADKNALFYLTILEDQGTYRQQSGQLKVQFPEITRRDWNTTTSQITTQDGYEYQSTTTSYTAVIEQGKQ